MGTLGIRRSLAVSVLVVLGLVAAAGCSKLPSAPFQTSPATSNTLRLLRAAPDAGLIGNVLGGATSSVQNTIQTVTGAIGGTVQAGRFTVDVPKDAFDGSGEITIDVPDPAVLKVDLKIANVPNHFNVPVTLVISYAGLNDELDPHPESYKIVWFNESTGKWEALPTVVDLDRGVVSAKLTHFSTYGVCDYVEAKAGW
jgi:hypothetical protein